MKAVVTLICVLLCGCATRTITTPEASATGRGAVRVAAPASLQPLWLAWDNNNSRDQWPALLCDIHSTTNLLQSFRPYALVGAWTNGVPFWPTNAQEFFIARFYDPVTQQYSEWSHK